MLSDEQMSKGWPFSLLNDEQMSNKVGVKHQPVDQSLIDLQTYTLVSTVHSQIRFYRRLKECRRAGPATVSVVRSRLFVGTY